MKILQAMLIDPYFALLAIGQFISYIGLILSTFYACKYLVKGCRQM